MDKEVLFIMIKGVTYQEVISPKVCVLFNDFEICEAEINNTKKRNSQIHITPFFS